jgi:Na+-transporting NADH:ubiquinone oxidoreductase subunit A
MHKVIKIRKGLDIRLKGEVESSLIKVFSPTLFAVEPERFRMMNPRLLVQEGDTVQCGTPVIQNKLNESMLLTAPVSGTVKRVVRGEKRKLLAIEIESDGNNSFVDFGKENPSSSTREAIVGKLLKSGLWPLMRQRPYAVIATPTDEPRDIFISAFSSAPLTTNTDRFISENKEAFGTGLEILQKLTTGAIHLGLHVRHNDLSVYEGFSNIEIQQFDGPHPSGNIGVQIHRISPINKGEVVWYLFPQDVVAIGHLFLTGKREIRRLVILAGSELKQPTLVNMLSEASVAGLLENNLTQDNVRVIGGDVLTGTNIGKDGFLGFYDQMISVIPEGDHYEFLGWALPGFKKHSMSRTFFAWLTPKKKYRLHTNFNGGERAFVVTNQYDKVFPFDIYPVHLLKAILVNDIELMEKLGIYEIAEEDFALCEYICTSKIESQQIVRNGIDTMIKEMS